MYAPRASAYRPLVNPTGTNPIGFNNSTDARKVTANQRQLIQGQGDILQQQAGDLANQYRDQAGGVEDYLHEAYDPMAAGQGGYNPEEAAAINLSPQEKQNMVTGAGISSGVGTAASVAAAERAAAAAGGNPMALATYRARAAQSQAANAGDSMTKARVTAKQLESQGAQTTGAARLGQQDKALGYYGQLQGQKNQNAGNQQALQQGAFSTTVGGTNEATGGVLKASQTPSKTDKIIGGVAGAAKGLLSFLEDGSDGYLDGTDAVVGEDGPEAIIEASPMMADGGEMSEDGVPMYSFDTGTPSPEYSNQGSGESGQRMPFRERAQGILQNYLAKNQQQPMGAPQKPAEQWNPTTPYQQLGDAIGSIAGKGISSAMTDKGGDTMAADGLSLQGDGPEDNGYNDNKSVSGYLWDSEGDGYLQDSPDGVMAMADGKAPGVGIAETEAKMLQSAKLQRNAAMRMKQGPGKSGEMPDHDTEQSVMSAEGNNMQRFAEEAMAMRRQGPLSRYKADGQAPMVASLRRYDDTPVSKQYGKPGAGETLRDYIKRKESDMATNSISAQIRQPNRQIFWDSDKEAGPITSGPTHGFTDPSAPAGIPQHQVQKQAEEAMAARRNLPAGEPGAMGPMYRIGTSYGKGGRYKADGQAPMPSKQYGRPDVSGPPRPGMQEEKFRSTPQQQYERSLRGPQEPMRLMRRFEDSPKQPQEPMRLMRRFEDSPKQPQEPMMTRTTMVQRYKPDGSTDGAPYEKPQPPMGNRYKADGQAPMPPKIVTNPTRVRLAPGDAVVPLTYRPHAKVRPSAFVNAYRGA